MEEKPLVKTRNRVTMKGKINTSDFIKQVLKVKDSSDEVTW